MQDIESWLKSEESIMMRAASSMAPDKETALDWVCEARLKVLAAARKHPDAGSGYYARIASHALISMLRASRRRYRDALIFSQCPTATSVVDLVEAPDDHDGSLTRLAVRAMKSSVKASHGAAAARAVAILASGGTWTDVAQELNLNIERLSILRGNLRTSARAYYNMN